jgi:4-deoxy-L-threo-5-hexosulose-uronate ketol-isomerase
MLTVETRHAIHPDHARTMGTDELRKHFLAGGMFADREIRLVYTHYDRLTVGGAVPAGGSAHPRQGRRDPHPTFLERREMGIVNIGETGTVATGDKSWTLEKGDVLYLGKGNSAVTFSGKGRFYITSCPAHATFPNRLITLGRGPPRSSWATRRPRTSGSSTSSSTRSSWKAASCVLGYTQLLEGSVWNTMPAHIHDRRMEAYLYWGMDDASRVIHLMGEPQETRHVVVANEEAVISPTWSIHAGAGIGSYTFIWAMAGDNVDYKDMDFIQPGEMK